MKLFPPGTALVGVPEITPVTLFSVAHEGNEPLTTLNVGAGEPLAVTVKVPGLPKRNVALFALEIAGDCVTVRVKLCVAAVPTPLLA